MCGPSTLAPERCAGCGTPSREPADPAFQTWARERPTHRCGQRLGSTLGGCRSRPCLRTHQQPQPDYYGGERLGSNSYADSVVALRGSSGKLVWDYQIVHHNIWDYDLPAQPSLITVRKDGRDIPAVAQATKMGFLFLLHRETGEPIFR